MKSSMKIYQTIQNMPKETQTQFFTDIQTQITKMNQKMEEIREEEAKKLTDSAEPFSEPKQTDGRSSQVKVAPVASVNTLKKENEETPLISKEQEPKNSKCIIM